MSDRVTLWANLTAAARGFASFDSRETKQALSDAAKAWAAHDSPKPTRVDTDTGDEPRVRFGRDKGKRLSEVKDLTWYRQALANIVADPAKARFKADNEDRLAEVEQELKRRG